MVAKGKCSFLCLSVTIYGEKRCKMSGEKCNTRVGTGKKQFRDSNLPLMIALDAAGE